MDNTCDGDHYSCGQRTEVTTGHTQHGEIRHDRSGQSSFMLGATEIIVNKDNRAFNMQYNYGWSSNPLFVIPQVDIAGVLIYISCGDTIDYYTSNHSVSETYHRVSTKLYFLDTRYNNAIGREVTEIITFSKASNILAGFKTMWGTQYFPKYTITNNTLNRTTVYFIVLNGVKTILKTETFSEVINGPENPLILVYPSPPSLAIPWINCDDINLFGFYDYHAVGAGEGQGKIQADGGDDYYFTDWMRYIGEVSQEQDQRDATDRYFEYYLGDGVTPVQSYSNPGVYTDDKPCGSIAVDPNGNIMYSTELGGEVFNFLTEGDLITFDERIPAGSKLFPVGII